MRRRQSWAARAHRLSRMRQPSGRTVGFADGSAEQFDRLGLGVWVHGGQLPFVRRFRRIQSCAG